MIFKRMVTICYPIILSAWRRITNDLRKLSIKAIFPNKHGYCYMSIRAQKI